MARFGQTSSALENTPGIVAACKALDDKFRKEMLATAEAFRHALWWYVGLRFAPGVKMGSAPEELVAAGPEGAAVSAAFNAVKAADELVSTTEAIANPGAELVQAARSLSQMTEVSAPQKVEVILEFIKRMAAIRAAGPHRSWQAPWRSTDGSMPPISSMFFIDLIARNGHRTLISLG